MLILVPLLICLGVLGLGTVVALPGAVITRRRHAATLRALPDTLPEVAARTYARHRVGPEIPLGGPERDWYDALDRYATVVDSFAAPRLEAIDTALAAFMVKHQIELPDIIKPVGPADCSPWAAVDLALVRLRVGIREPIWYERTCTADTGMWDTGELHALLDASEACEVAA